METQKRDEYRLDKSAFKMTTAEEAANHFSYWKDKSMRERLNAAFYLIHQAYGTTSKTRLDRTVFSKRKHNA